ncbi:DUF2590 family protein [Ferrimonas senticii]|uniref:DUF2590 family protein n=1 Tax=Ferrimonas senticii TaxID=394566 RepID=UPI000480407C|nr:DUF2590 family protein [Ferrimonas senticii]
MDKAFVDLLIADGGLMLDDGQQPLQVDGTPSIGQDIRHTIMESGLARKLLGNRSQAERADVLTEIELLVEQDARLVSGSIWIEEQAHDRYLLTAQTQHGDGLNLEITP